MDEDDDDDDLDMDAWMSMSDAQQDVMLDREMREHEQWYDGLTLKEQVRYQTRSAMRLIMENRARLRKPDLCTIPFVVGLWREGVRRNQRRLVKIRMWRATGTYPGEA